MPLVHGLDQPGDVDGVAGGGAQGGVLEGAVAGVEVEGGGTGHGHLVEERLVDGGDLRDGDRLDEVGLTRAQGGSTGGAVGHEGDVDAGGLGPLAPVVVVALEGGGGGAVHGGQLERAGAVATGSSGPSDDPSAG